MKKVVLTFEDDLSVTVEAEGFEGRACDAAVRPYEEEFGVKKRTYKRERDASRSRTREAER